MSKEKRYATWEEVDQAAVTIEKRQEKIRAREAAKKYPATNYPKFSFRKEA